MMRARPPARRRRPNQAGVGILLAIAAIVLAMPVDVVWCRSTSGHSALEFAWGGCCRPDGAPTACSPAAAPVARAADVSEFGIDSAPCTDRWIGAPFAVAPPGADTDREPGGTASPAGALPARSSTPFIASTRSPAPFPWQVQALLGTTVLTI